MNIKSTHITNTAETIREKEKMPFLVQTVIIFTLISCIGGSLFDVRITSLGWLVPLLIGAFSLLKDPKGITLPVKIWLPWVLVIVIYQLFAEAEHSLQRSIMLVTPLVVGAAVSKNRLGQEGLEAFLRLCRYTAAALLLIVLFKTKMLLTGALPYRTGLAPEVISGSLLCVIFASSYVLGNKRDFAWWTAIAAIPVIAVTRMGMMGAAISLPFTLAPMKRIKRVAFVALLLVIGINIFYTERIQQKMFYSGEGRLEDIRWENPNFATSGRKVIWERMEAGIAGSPWFGNGANSSEDLVLSIVPGLTHPHNDWLRLGYDYGYVGAGIFALTLLLQMLDLLKKARASSGNKSLLFYAGASSMLIFPLFMFSDNIILYAAFFGNLQFTILGLAYGSYQPGSGDKKPAPRGRRLRIKW
jgi:hypothetical protein